MTGAIAIGAGARHAMARKQGDLDVRAPKCWQPASRIGLANLSEILIEMLQALRIGLHRDTGGRKGHPLEQAQFCSVATLMPIRSNAAVSSGKLIGAHGVQSQRHRLTDHHFDPALPFPRAIVIHGDRMTWSGKPRLRLRGR